MENEKQTDRFICMLKWLSKYNITKNRQNKYLQMIQEKMIQIFELKKIRNKRERKRIFNAFFLCKKFQLYFKRTNI